MANFLVVLISQLLEEFKGEKVGFLFDMFYFQVIPRY